VSSSSRCIVDQNDSIIELSTLDPRQHQPPERPGHRPARPTAGVHGRRTGRHPLRPRHRLRPSTLRRRSQRRTPRPSRSTTRLRAVRTRSRHLPARHQRPDPRDPIASTMSSPRWQGLIRKHHQRARLIRVRTGLGPDDPPAGREQLVRCSRRRSAVNLHHGLGEFRHPPRALSRPPADEIAEPLLRAFSMDARTSSQASPRERDAARRMSAASRPAARVSRSSSSLSSA
jgi:hypothetical protein